MFVSMLISLAMVVAFFTMAGSKARMAWTCWFCFFLFIVFVFVGSSYLLAQAVFLGAAAVICLVTGAGRTAAGVAAVVSTLLSYGAVFGLMVQPELDELASLRKEYPFESLEQRLAYEAMPARDSVAVSDSSKFSSEVEQHLVSFETRGHRSWRNSMLANLHNRTRDEFVTAQGFGQRRMSGIRRHVIELPETPPVSLPAPPDDDPRYDADGSADDSLAARNSGPPPGRSTLFALHRSGLDDFRDRERMGYVRKRGQVAGFQSHRFTSVPAAERIAAKWQVTRLELVSLLKHESPRAYVSEYLPQMDKLHEAATRPLDGFEESAVEKLRYEDDLVVQEEIDRIRMVGSLRAGKDCLDCHHVSRGHLLGAFSYELVRHTPPGEDGR